MCLRCYLGIDVFLLNHLVLAVCLGLGGQDANQEFAIVFLSKIKGNTINLAVFCMTLTTVCAVLKLTVQQTTCISKTPTISACEFSN